MAEYFTIDNLPKRRPTPSGDEFLNLYQEEIIKDGTKQLVAIGKKNVYDMIQEDLESTKIENILKSVAMGDLSMLRSQEPIYIDATTMPKNLMEASNIVLKAKQEFEKLPMEVKQKFDNDADLYVSEMGTKEFLEKMAPYNKYLNDVKEAGSLKAYQKKVAEEAKFQNDVAAAKGGNANES